MNSLLTEDYSNYLCNHDILHLICEIIWRVQIWKENLEKFRKFNVIIEEKHYFEQNDHK